MVYRLNQPRGDSIKMKIGLQLYRAQSLRFRLVSIEDYVSQALSLFVKVKNGTFTPKITHLPGDLLTHLLEKWHICQCHKLHIFLVDKNIFLKSA